jgi:hypothetical protein
MQIAEFVEMLCQEIEKIGSQKKAAQEWGISTQYLNDVIRYRREPGRKILDEFGMYKSVTYEMKDTSDVGFSLENIPEHIKPAFEYSPRAGAGSYLVHEDAAEAEE